MNGADLGQALLRRWYVLVPGLFLAGAMGFLTLRAVPPDYEAGGYVLLLPPQTVTTDGGNPFLSLGGLELPGEIVVNYLNGDEAKAAIAERAPNAAYTIEVDPRTRGPVLAVTVEDESPAAAIDALGVVLESVPRALSSLQSGLAVAPENAVSSMVLAADTESSTVMKTTLRAVLAVVGVAVLAVFFGAVALDGLLVRRRSARSGRALHRVESDRELSLDDSPVAIDSDDHSRESPDRGAIYRSSASDHRDLPQSGTLAVARADELVASVHEGPASSAP